MSYYIKNTDEALELIFKKEKDKNLKNNIYIFNYNREVTYTKLLFLLNKYNVKYKDIEMYKNGFLILINNSDESSEYGESYFNRIIFKGDILLEDMY